MRDPTLAGEQRREARRASLAARQLIGRRQCSRHGYPCPTEESIASPCHACAARPSHPQRHARCPPADRELRASPRLERCDPAHYGRIGFAVRRSIMWAGVLLPQPLRPTTPPVAVVECEREIGEQRPDSGAMRWALGVDTTSTRRLRPARSRLFCARFEHCALPTCPGMWVSQRGFRGPMFGVVREHFDRGSADARVGEKKGGWAQRQPLQ